MAIAGIIPWYKGSGTGIMHQFVHYASQPHFRVGFCPKNFWKTLKPAKPYNFAIEGASDRPTRLVFAISEHRLMIESMDGLTLCPRNAVSRIM